MGEQVEAELNIKSGEKWSSWQAKTVRRLGEEEEKLLSGVRSSQTLRKRSPQTESDLYLEIVQHKFVWFSRDSGETRGSGFHSTVRGDFGTSAGLEYAFITSVECKKGANFCILHPCVVSLVETTDTD